MSEDGESRMWLHTNDRRGEREAPGQVMNRSWRLFNSPRLIPVCRLRGHKPVVDGHGTPGEHRGSVARWVACDRCGTRPEPQGVLDAHDWQVGQRYTGPYRTRVITKAEIYAVKAGEQPPAADAHLPGPWPERPTGSLGAEVVVGGHYLGPSVRASLGSAGSEDTLSGHIALGRIGGVYLNTEQHGTWLQRRLIPTGYYDREVSAFVMDGRFHWSMWAREGHSSRDDPWWMRGSFPVNLLDAAFGSKRYSYDDTGEPVEAVVRMPQGDDHPVRLQLQRQRHGRRRGHADYSWVADWEALDDGIPVKPHRGGVLGSGVKVSPAAVESGQWPDEAAAAIAADLSRDRARYGYRERTAA